MLGDEDHPLTHQPVGDGDRLLGVALVITNAEFEFFAQYTALRVDVCNRLARNGEHLFAQARQRSGDGLHCANGDLRADCQRRHRKQASERQSTKHCSLMTPRNPSRRQRPARLLDRPESRPLYRPILCWPSMVGPLEGG